MASLLVVQKDVQVVFFSNKKLCISLLFLHLLVFVVNVVKINPCVSFVLQLKRSCYYQFPV